MHMPMDRLFDEKIITASKELAKHFFTEHPTIAVFSLIDRPDADVYAMVRQAGTDLASGHYALMVDDERSLYEVAEQVAEGITTVVVCRKDTHAQTAVEFLGLPKQLLMDY